MVIQFKCPDCGRDMMFDTNSARLKCDACGHEEVIEGAIGKEDFQVVEDSGTPETFFSDEEENVVQYQCQNCGAVILTDKSTTATTCSFCDAPVILGDKLTGVLAPDKVIPFKISKKEAEAAFKKWCAALRYAPREFRRAAKMKDLSGVYVPFWLYDVAGQGEVLYDCTRSRVFSSGDYTITETSHFDVYRKADIRYRRVPSDASERMDDKLMDLLEPYDYSTLKPFNTPYLAGYLAEKYDYKARDLFPRVETRIRNYMDVYMDDQVNGYETKRMNKKNYQVLQEKADYALLPVWMAYYNYDKGEYTFAMNGETGKVAGRPPVSTTNVIGRIGGWTFLIFAICRLITMLLGGPIL